jgi:hypothetical protein
LAALTTSRKPHQIATGFDQVSQATLRDDPMLVTEAAHNCNNCDTTRETEDFGMAKVGCVGHRTSPSFGVVMICLHVRGDQELRALPPISTLLTRAGVARTKVKPRRCSRCARSDACDRHNAEM